MQLFNRLLTALVAGAGFAGALVVSGMLTKALVNAFKYGYSLL